MTLHQPWITRLKQHTGYDVDTDGLVWPKYALEYDRTSMGLTSQDLLLDVLTGMFPHFEKQWCEEPATRPQWLSVAFFR